MQASAEPARREARAFFALTGASYDRVARWATLGQDPRWRRALLRGLPRGADVLDYACGTGLLSLAAARRCGPGRVVGVDLSEAMLAQARAKAAREGLDIRFVHGDAEAWKPAEGSFDVILAAYLPKYVDFDLWLSRAAPALRPGGRLLAYDFTLPANSWALRGWRLWWRIVRWRLAKDPAWKAVARDLGPLLARTRWVEAMQQALPRHGLAVDRVRSRAFGALTVIEASRRDKRALSPSR